MIRPALIFCLFLLAMPLAGQEAPNLNETLIDQRIAHLRGAGAAESDETLKTYEAAKSWLTQTASHTSDRTLYIQELTDAPQREAEIQTRLDAMESEQEQVENLETLLRLELETQLTQIQTSLREANESLAALDRRLAARESNAELIRNRVGEIAKRLTAMPDQVAIVDPSATPSIAEASQWREQAELMSLRAERRTQSAQLDSQPVRFSAMRVERAELRVKADRLALRAERFSAQLRSEQYATPDPEIQHIETDSPMYQLGQQYRVNNVAMGEQLLALESRLAQAKTEREMVASASRVLNERFARARRVVDFATQSDALGQVLLAYWKEIDNLRLPDPRRGIPRQLGDSVINRIGHEEDLAALASATAYMTAGIIDAELDPGTVTQSERDILVELLQARRGLLRNIIATESGFIDTLSELEADYTAYVKIIEAYQDYLDPLVLWIPSDTRLWKSSFKQLPDEIPVLVRSVSSIKPSLGPVFFGSTILALILFLLGSRLRDFQHSQNRLISRPREDAIYYTLVALAMSGLRAAPSALAAAALASLFQDDASASGVALSAALNNLVIILFAVKFLSILCEDCGVARHHFNWDAARCDRVGHDATWIMRWLLPGITIAGFLYRVDDAAALIGRLAMLFVAFSLAAYFARNLWKSLREEGSAGFSSNENRARLIIVFLFIAIVAGVIFGLRYSVGIITTTLLDMLKVGIALAIVHSFMLRWLKVARRRLRFEELVNARTLRSEQAASELGVVEEDQARLAELGEETQQLLNVVTIVVVLTILYYLWAPNLPLFDAMSRITLWTSTSMVEGEAFVSQITLDVLVFVVMLISITVYAAKKLPALVELVLRSRTNVSPGARYTASTLLNYVILGTGFLVALSRLGLDWSRLQWLVAALGVGIGFGLQEIVANFISGLIILFERPISVGDIITVGEKDGVVTRIRIRATTIRDWDNKELLIPNKEIITGRLVNWSLSDTRLRLSVPVGVAYGSDVTLALKILDETVADDERIMKEPAPSIIFSNFGESSLDLICRFYIDNIDHMWPVQTSLRLEIYRRFEEAGIVIAFPQRDVHLASEHPLRISIDPGPVAE